MTKVSTCPKCGAVVISKQIRPGGDSDCKDGHTFPSREAVIVEQQDATVNAPVQRIRIYKGAGWDDAEKG